MNTVYWLYSALQYSRIRLARRRTLPESVSQCRAGGNTTTRAHKSAGPPPLRRTAPPAGNGSFAPAGPRSGGDEQARGEHRARDHHDRRSGRHVPFERSEQAGGDRGGAEPRRGDHHLLGRRGETARGGRGMITSASSMPTIFIPVAITTAGRITSSDVFVSVVVRRRYRSWSERVVEAADRFRRRGLGAACRHGGRRPAPVDPGVANRHAVLYLECQDSLTEMDSRFRGNDVIIQGILNPET